MAIQFQFRRGLASDWTTANPVLASGEPGYETDTGKFKYGDGSTAWNSLSYSSGPAGPTGPTGATPNMFYTFTQSTPASTWNITHGLNGYPAVTVFDSANNQCIGAITYTSLNTLTITFSAAFSGTAYVV